MRNFHNKINLIFILIVSVFISSCGSWLLPEFNVLSAEFNRENNEVKITFSDTPEKNLFTENFSLKENNIEVKGRFNFKNTTVVFIPENGIQDYCVYNLEIKNGAESTYGTSLLNDFKFEYSTKADDICPKIISITPENEEEISNKIESITINFSKQINVLSFETAFSITPNVDSFYKWSENNDSVEVIFKKNLEKNTIYKIKITTDLMDTQNNYLVDEYVSSFNNLIDFSELEMEVNFKNDDTLFLMEEGREYSPEEFCPLSDGKIEINFSNEINVDALTSYISFYPALEFSITPDFETRKKITIEFKQTPQFNSSYTMTIKKGITDVYGHKILEQKKYKLSFCNERNRPVEFIEGYFQTFPDLNSESWFTFNEDNIYSDININPEPAEGGEQNENTEKKVFCFYVFKISSEATSIDLLSTMDALQIICTNSCASCVAYKHEVISGNNFESSYWQYKDFINNTYLNENYCILVQHINLRNNNSSGTIKFTIRATIKDNIGNNLIKEVVLPYNKL